MNDKIHYLQRRLDLARQALPLPDLLSALGLSQHCRRSCKSPLRKDNNPSFGIFQKEGRWWWKDHGSGEGGDEISFISAYTQCSRKEACNAYLEMSKV